MSEVFIELHTDTGAKKFSVLSKRKTRHGETPCFSSVPVLDKPYTRACRVPAQ